jgi:hypothetical protein
MRPPEPPSNIPAKFVKPIHTQPRATVPKPPNHPSTSNATVLVVPTICDSVTNPVSASISIVSESSLAPTPPLIQHNSYPPHAPSMPPPPEIPDASSNMIGVQDNQETPDHERDIQGTIEVTQSARGKGAGRGRGHGQGNGRGRGNGRARKNNNAYTGQCNISIFYAQDLLTAFYISEVPASTDAPRRSTRKSTNSA